ncbi:MAG: nitroreductase [Methylophilaceae bacterium]|nr:MAG: nitroreductase [Methylophilaceae bacterium]
MIPSHKAEITFFEVILGRRSVRNYQAKRVGKISISSLLEAAVRAPTAMHQEPWAFVIINDKKTLKSLSDLAKPLIIAKAKLNPTELNQNMKELFDNPDFNIFYDAGTLIIICGKTDSPFYSADCWLAAENMMLAACAMGLGSCVVENALPALNLNDVKAQLKISDKYTAVAPIIIGYPNQENTATTRNAPVILTQIAPN